MENQENLNDVRVAATLAACSAAIDRVIRRCKIRASKAHTLKDYVLSELGRKIADDPALCDLFMQADPYLNKAILNLVASFMRSAQKQFSRESVLTEELEALACDPFDDVVFRLSLERALSQDEQRYAKLKILGLSDQEVILATGESRRKINSHRDAVKQALLQVFKE